MNTRPLVYLLSAVAVALGAMFLLSSISNPSTDSLVLARDVATGALAIALGVAAPLLIRRFTQ